MGAEASETNPDGPGLSPYAKHPVSGSRATEIILNCVKGSREKRKKPPRPAEENARWETKN